MLARFERDPVFGVREDSLAIVFAARVVASMISTSSHAAVEAG
jgi:hypothetical protein